MGRKKGQAAVISKAQLKLVIKYVRKNNPNPVDMELAFKLSYYAGMRVQEIAGLQWSRHIFTHNSDYNYVTHPLYDASGDPLLDENGDQAIRRDKVIVVTKDIGKYGKKRDIPINPKLLKMLQKASKHRTSDWVIPSALPSAGLSLTKRAGALKMRINRTYKKIGMTEHSSHSGRRSAITTWSRFANTVGGSLRDVQQMAGHSNLATTQGYIEVSPQQADIVNKM